MLKKGLLYLLLFVCFGAFAQNNRRAKVHLDTNKIYVGDQILVHFEVLVNENEQLDNTADSANTLLDTATFEVLTDSHWQEDFYQNQKKISRHLKVTVWDTGIFMVRPLPFTILSVSGNYILEADPRFVEVAYPNGVEAMQYPEALKDIEREDWWWSDYKWQIIGGVLILILVVYIVLKLQKLSKTGYIRQLLKRQPEQPHVIALFLLQKLKNKKLLESGNIKAYYSELTDILRGYLQNRFSVALLDKTTTEQLGILSEKDVLDTVQLEKIQTILTTADWVKFAKYFPDEKASAAFLEDAIAIVQQTKQEKGTV